MRGRSDDGKDEADRWGRVTGAVLLVVVLTMAVSVLTVGTGGPLALHHVRDHLVAMGVVVAGLWLLSIRGGLRAEPALAGVLLVFVCVLAGSYAAEGTEREVALPNSPARAAIVHRSGLVDGETCVVVRSGSAPWSWREPVLCRSDDDPDRAVVDARWASPGELRIVFGDGSTSDHAVP